MAVRIEERLVQHNRSERQRNGVPQGRRHMVLHMECRPPFYVRFGIHTYTPAYLLALDVNSQWLLKHCRT